MSVTIKLSESFIEKMKEHAPNWGPLGWVTYKRTYARWIESEGRNEEWHETIRRVIEGNINLDPRLQEEVVPLTLIEELRVEAEKMFEIFYNLLATPPGRGLWMSGTEFAERTGDALNNCLRGSEKVFVKDAGLIPIKELAGHTVKVLSDGGVYRKAEFKSFGKQPLMKVVFGDGQEVFATPNHEWVVLQGSDGQRVKNRVYTKDLMGKHIPIIRPQVPSKADSEGIAHGFIFGDGTRLPMGYCQVQYFKEDKDLFQKIAQFGCISKTKIPTISRLPGDWKKLPNISNYTKEYLIGFLIGYIAADGHVRGTSTRLHCKDEITLEGVREIAAYLGLKVNPVRTERENSPFTGKRAPLYSISFSSETFPGHLLAREAQRSAWKTRKKNSKGSL